MAIKKGKLGIWMLTTLVAGNMIGSGIFLLPSSLAKIGSISLLSWCFTALGAFMLALVFSKMSTLVPKTGGPYAYAYAGFGDFIGFQTAFNYWVTVWVGNAAIAIAAAGYLAVFWPVLAHPMPACIFSIVVVWILTLVNIGGVHAAGLVQVVTTIFKLIPILLVAVLGWWYFHPGYLTQAFNVSHHTNFYAISNAATLTLWAFIGLESATIPAGNVDNPEKIIPVATLLGTLIASVVYIASSAAIMGMIPPDVLAQSTSPFAAAAAVIFGKWGEWIIAIGAAIACLGCLNGWILLQGQVPMAAADDQLFPRIFAKRNKDGTPVWALVLTSILVTGLLFFTISPNLNAQFQFIILIASLAALIPYLYTAIAEIIVLKQQGKASGKRAVINIIIAILAATYSFWATFGSGMKIVFYGMMLVFFSIPLYAIVYWQRNKKKLIAETQVSES